MIQVMGCSVQRRHAAPGRSLRLRRADARIDKSTRGARHTVHRRGRRALTLRGPAAILPALPLILLPRTVPIILVADDNPVSLRFFADALERLGLESEPAHDGIEALARARRTRFDLLLLDARMPGLGGAEALARIRAEPGPSRDAPALATTAEVDDAVRARLGEAGFAGVIAKPVTLHALRSALAVLLPIAADGSAQASADGLDDARALAATGGDASILAALRGLLIAELDALPAEIAGFAARNDTEALRDRLHRLDASAGFCGTPALTRACAMLRTAHDAESAWPAAATAAFLAACAEVRARLAEAASTRG
jgi:CheY-like chemotaxis protein/HPt (histidine-containing phosphotransfer) domain-containing protein